MSTTNVLWQRVQQFTCPISYDTQGRDSLQFVWDQADPLCKSKMESTLTSVFQVSRTCPYLNYPGPPPRGAAYFKTIVSPRGSAPVDGCYFPLMFYRADLSPLYLQGRSTLLTSTRQISHFLRSMGWILTIHMSERQTLILYASRGGSWFPMFREVDSYPLCSTRGTFISHVPRDESLCDFDRSYGLLFPLRSWLPPHFL